MSDESLYPAVHPSALQGQPYQGVAAGAVALVSVLILVRSGVAAGSEAMSRPSISLVWPAYIHAWPGDTWTEMTETPLWPALYEYIVTSEVPDELDGWPWNVRRVH